MNKAIRRVDTYIPKPTKEQIEEIGRLNNLFYENEHELLRGGRVKTGDKRSLNDLYYYFFNKVDNHDWSKSLIEMELDNLKSDPFCKHNTNKEYWTKSIILGWIVDLPRVLNVRFLYNQLSSREANQRLIRFAYWSN